MVETAAKRSLKERRHLADARKQDERVTAHLQPAEIATLFDPSAYQGVAQAFIDRLIALARNLEPV
jgi:adenylosuccinate lyase